MIKTSQGHIGQMVYINFTEKPNRISLDAIKITKTVNRSNWL